MIGLRTSDVKSGTSSIKWKGRICCKNSKTTPPEAKTEIPVGVACRLGDIPVDKEATAEAQAIYV